MTQEVFAESELNGLPNRDAAPDPEARNSDPANKAHQEFQKQQENNLHVKAEMVRELAAMGLRNEEIRLILHLEDKIPF